MVKPFKWFNKLFHHRRKTTPTICAPQETPNNYSEADNNDENSKDAIAVAAATAAVAEAALAAAKAAVEVVRLTSNSKGNVGPSNVRKKRLLVSDLAAVKIQSAFRGYLARRALQALKGLVKLQALVRGHFVRKQSTDMLRRLQALVRVQARARSTRVLNIESSHCSPSKQSSRRHEIYSISEKLENSTVLKRCGSNSSIRDSSTNWLDNWVEVGSSITSSNFTKTPHTNDEPNNDKILEIDNPKPDPNPKARKRVPNPNNLKPLQHISAQDYYYNHSFSASDYKNPVSEKTVSLKSLHFPLKTASMRRSPKTTPSRDECSRSYINGYSTFASPSYMANTQSSRAKTRSQSVPRLRGGDPNKVGSVKRSLQAFWESKTSSKRGLDREFNGRMGVLGGDDLN